MFFYPGKVLFSGFLQFQGIFVDDYLGLQGDTRVAGDYKGIQGLKKMWGISEEPTLSLFSSRVLVSQIACRTRLSEVSD